VTREEVWQAALSDLRSRFGALLDVRDVRRVRRVAGEGWLVSVVMPTSKGDVHVADLRMDEEGTASPVLSADHLVAAVERHLLPKTKGVVIDELADFGTEQDDAGPMSFGLGTLSEEVPVSSRVRAAITRGDAASLAEARELLPRLLADHAQRGKVLFTMAEVEQKLGEKDLAGGYLEAASREFADRFDLDALEKAAAMALELYGRDGYGSSKVHALLEQSRARLRPIASVYDSRTFAGLAPELRQELEQHMTTRTLAPGETLVTEGEPSRFVFVVKSGLLGVWLERPEGGSWLVRCCFPGWLLGESSVLGDGDARCTATLKAERVAEVLVCPAEIVRKLAEADPSLAQRLAETKELHRIDSFFSMHETMSQLDVRVRDEILSCLQRLETFVDDTVVLPANAVPTVACLVARGSLTLVSESGEPLGAVEADGFYGVRDTIHAIAPSVSAVAKAGSTVAFFEGTRLQKLCERSPEHVVAVLERLG
jgi:CRP-like cAMP-binding protein